MGWLLLFPIHKAGPMARALKLHAVISDKTLPLPDLSAFDGKRVEVIVIEDDVPAEIETPQGERPPGLLRGEFIVPDDFDDPLSSEIQEYFEDEAKQT